MQEIVFLSGKGGTGKTSLSASCAFLEKTCVTCDYDVEASNMHLLFNLNTVPVETVNAGQLASIDPEGCIACGLCETLCRFDAIRDLEVKSRQCEGCGLCYQVCPVRAVLLKPRLAGVLCQSGGDFQLGHFHARLLPGAGNSGRVVSRLKDLARHCAASRDCRMLISDGPPGIGCSVIASLTGACLAVMVTEPGISAFEDLQRLWALMQSRQVSAALVINKWDLNPGYTRRIETWAEQNSIPLAGRLPFSESIAGVLARGEIPASNRQLAGDYEEIWLEIKSHAAAAQIAAARSLSIPLDT